MEGTPSCWQLGTESCHPIRSEVRRIQDHICRTTGIKLLGGLLADMGLTSPFEPILCGEQLLA